MTAARQFWVATDCGNYVVGTTPNRFVVHAGGPLADYQGGPMWKLEEHCQALGWKISEIPPESLPTPAGSGN